MRTRANAGETEILLQPDGTHSLVCLGMLLDALFCLPNEDLKALPSSSPSAPCNHQDAAISRTFNVKQLPENVGMDVECISLGPVRIAGFKNNTVVWRENLCIPPFSPQLRQQRCISRLCPLVLMDILKA